jgi:hypothetical protein
MMAEESFEDSNQSKSEYKERLRNLAIWIFGFIVLTFVVPLILIFGLPEDKRYVGFAILGAVPVMEYLAISIGISLDINPVISFLLTWLPCMGLCMLVFGILEFLKDSSKRATRFLEKAHKKIDKYPRLKKYGIASNFFFVMFLGVYIAPGITIILGWPKGRSLVFMGGGIAFITGLIGLGTMGIIDLFFL